MTDVSSESANRNAHEAAGPPPGQHARWVGQEWPAELGIHGHDNRLLYLDFHFMLSLS